MSYQLSAISYQLSAIRHRSSVPKERRPNLPKQIRAPSLLS